MMKHNHDTATQPTPQMPLAIIGIGCLFPKAPNLNEYWTNIREGVDAMTDIPPDHWKIEEYFQRDPKAPDHTYAARGAFLPTIDFNPLEFGILPNALEATDTAQLLSLVAAQEALRDAGYGDERDFDRTRVSVILGVTGTLELVIPLGARLGHPIWRKALHEAGVDERVTQDVIERIQQEYVDWQENSFPGLLGNVVAGRIANRFDLGGTNCVVDAACASSLSALHLASLELSDGRADMVVTGGVDAFNDIFMYMCFSKTLALSPSGQVRPFDQQGDGTALGEGIGILVIKRLEDAQRDRDHIYAVIKGLGSSSDGKGTAIYTPSADGQIRALCAAYHHAGVTADTVELMEAHGTGTKVGDATEVQSMISVYGALQTNGAWCALGSVKSQIGHTKAAAGVAGLIKAALALHHKVLPPTINVEQPLPELAPDQTPFYLNTEKRPWLPALDHPRRAAVSAFGFGGSNFHCVLEEYTPEKTEIDWTGRTQLLAFSAQTPEQLGQRLDAVDPNVDWQTLRRQAAQWRREFNRAHPCRLTLVVEHDHSGMATMQAHAHKMLQQQPQSGWSTPDGIFYSVQGVSGKLGWIFPGQGSQYVGMLRDFACQFPQFHDVLTVANRIFHNSGEPGSRPLSDLIYPHPAFSEEIRQHQTAALQSTQVAQPAIGAVSLGLLKVLEYFGLHPAYVAGHSYGELVALYASGVLDVETFFALSKLRGQLMGQTQGDKGSMIAVQADAVTVSQIIRTEGLDLVIANKNSPQQTVLSGATREIERAKTMFTNRQVRCKQLSVAAAFHSRFVADASGAFSEALGQVALHPPQLPVFANSTGELYPAEVARIRQLLAEQLTNPVEFIQIIETMYANGVRTFLEVGPSAQMNGLIKAILKGKPVEVLSVDASVGRRSGETDLARAIGQLAALGYEVQLTAWDDVASLAVAEQLSPKRAMTVPIGGTNYRKPRPAKPAATPSSPIPSAPVAGTALPPIQPARPAILFPRPEPPQHDSDGNGHHRSRLTEPPPHVSPASPAGVSGGMDVTEVFRIIQENLRALQQFQEQTADLHRQFLEGQDAARQSIDRLLEQQQRLLQGVPLTSVTAPATDFVTPVTLDNGNGARSHHVPLRSAPPSAQDMLSHHAPSSPMAVPRATVPVTGAAEAQPHPTASPEARPVDAPSQTSPLLEQRQPVERVLMAVVAEKTGYPVDMLESDMGLEADLGIDSIKRVEILSALQERLPDAPPIGAEHLGKLQTLAQIADFLRANGNGSAQPAIPQPAVSHQPEKRVAEVLLAVVADKTGYPVDMLELGMGLETDLGIDSIKRVEILSALQGRLPDAPPIGAEHLGKLQTLGQIADFLRGNGNGSAKPARGHPAPPPAASERQTDQDVAGIVLAVVADKTGYPADMLELDMGLEADLGIDSIKRVEILSVLQGHLPDAPPIGAEYAGKIQTLRDIVELLSNAQSVQAQAAPKIAAPVPVPSDAGLSPERSLVHPILLTAPDSRPRMSLPANALVWITDETTSLTAEIERGLQERGLRTRRIALSDIPSLSVPEYLGGLVILAPPGDALSEHFLPDVFTLLQMAGPGLRRAGQSILLTVSRLDGAFGFGNLTPQANPLSGGLAGLAKTVGQEWRNVHSKAIDLAVDTPDIPIAATAIVDEMFCVGPTEVGLGKAGKITLALSRTPLPDDPRAVQFDHADVIVITGGARGVTAECAIALAQAAQPTVILFGRSPSPTPEPEWLRELSAEAALKQAIVAHAGRPVTPKEVAQEYHRILANREIQRNLARIETTGARVQYYAVDLRDAAAVHAALRDAQQRFGDITGLLHGAGVLADRRIEEKTAEQFGVVYSTKVQGLQTLLAALQNAPLKALLLFSSTTARFGRIGQIDYAVANEVLNKIAQQQARRRPSCRVVSVNWGPWDGGMVTPALKHLFAQEGVQTIPLAAGAEYLVRELSQGEPSAVEVVVLGAGSTVKEHARADVSSAPQTGMALAFERVLDLDAHPFLKSHVIDGHAVLPAAMIIEWMAHSALHANPGLQFQGVDDFQILKGVILSESRQYLLQMFTGKARKVNGGYRVPVELRGGMDRPLLHARAVCLVGTPLPQATPSLHEITTMDHPYGPDEIYRHYLFHGADFQGIEQVEGCSAIGISARSKPAPPPSAWIKHPLRSHWLTDPLVIDSSFQLLILWSLQQYRAGSLPTAFGRYRQFQPRFPSDGGHIIAHVTERQAHRAVANIEFLDQQDRLIAKIEAYECVIDGSLNQAFRKNTLPE